VQQQHGAVMSVTFTGTIVDGLISSCIHYVQPWWKIWTSYNQRFVGSDTDEVLLQQVAKW